MPAPDNDLKATYTEAGAPTPEAKEVWPLWKLAILGLPQVSVQMIWAFLGPNTATFLGRLGAPDSVAALLLQCGPFTGFFVGPLVGATSDRLTSRFGRRRPVIFVGLVSTWVAGMLFAGADYVVPGKNAYWFAGAMLLVMDVTINVLQTPHRALVADLASEDQAIPTQVIFVCLMSVGNALGFTMMKLYPKAIAHMVELMVLVCALNTLTVGIQFAVAKETPLQSKPGERPSVIQPLLDVGHAVRYSPRLLYHLAFVHCLVWSGLTVWNSFGGQWFGVSVYEGDFRKGATKEAEDKWDESQQLFSTAGLGKSFVQLVTSLLIIFIMLNKLLPPRLAYAPCIFVGAVVSILAAFFVGHNGTLALLCMMFSVLPEVGSFAIPFGLVAVLNKRAEKEGKPVSNALQMALLNSCITVGQEITIVSTGSLEHGRSIAEALKIEFTMAGVLLTVAGIGALLLNDTDEEDEDEDSDSDDSVE
jgi:Na+/melibiose symporter-like transporter